MKFELRHAMPRSSKVTWKALFSEEYDKALTARGDHDREVLEEGERAGKHYRRSRITSRKELPGFMQKVVGSTNLSYELEEWRDDARHELKWKVTPPTARDKVRAEGSYRLIDLPRGCERFVNGEISVSVPLVGGKIEKAIADELRASYDQSAEFARTWLLEHTSETESI